MTQYGTWVSYAGSARIVLALVLASIAVGVAYAAVRMPLPARLPSPGRKAMAALVTVWLLAIAAFVAGFAGYAGQAHRDHLGQPPPADPITPVTVIGVSVVLVAVTLAHNARGWRVALGSGVIAALAAPMIFELPFDLIVMARTYPPIPPDPTLYRALFFGPLFLVEVLTLALLASSPVLRLSRAALWSFAAMLAVFAVWALIGFGYPAHPAPCALNVAAMILAFVTTLAMFAPERAGAASGSSGSPHEARPRAWSTVM